MKQVKDRKALITGCSPKGIGYATAKLFKQRGYDVVILGRDDVQQTSNTAEELGVDYLIADMASISTTLDKAEVVKFFPDGLDVLINNAAIAQFMPFEAISEPDFNLSYRTNVLGPMLLIQSLLPYLVKRSGVITNISSIIVNNSLPNTSLYAGTKGALEAFSRGLALELAPHGVRVNMVAPGAIETALASKQNLTSEELSQIKANIEAITPLARYGTPDEVAEVILAQAESAYVTGSVWTVDGGVSIT